MSRIIKSMETISRLDTSGEINSRGMGMGIWEYGEYGAWEYGAENGSNENVLNLDCIHVEYAKIQ